MGDATGEKGRLTSFMVERELSQAGRAKGEAMKRCAQVLGMPPENLEAFVKDLATHVQ